MTQPNQLTLIQEMNLMKNRKVILWLNIATLPLLFVFGLFFSFVITLFSHNPTESSVLLTDLFIFLFSFFLVIIIHEGIHGFFFKLFNPIGKVKFGFKNGMAYATSPNSFYTKKAFTLIILAPFLLISLSLTILVLLGILAPITYVALGSIHASSCVGDFYFIWLLIKAPKSCLVEDTEQGINFYQRNN